mgnify:FL=1
MGRFNGDSLNETLKSNADFIASNNMGQKKMAYFESGIATIFEADDSEFFSAANALGEIEYANSLGIKLQKQCMQNM